MITRGLVTLLRTGASIENLVGFASAQLTDWSLSICKSLKANFETLVGLQSNRLTSYQNLHQSHDRDGYKKRGNRFEEKALLNT